jgi:hypothetical protein
VQFGGGSPERGTRDIACDTDYVVNADRLSTGVGLDIRLNIGLGTSGREDAPGDRS